MRWYVKRCNVHSLTRLHSMIRLAPQKGVKEKRTAHKRNPDHAIMDQRSARQCSFQSALFVLRREIQPTDHTILSGHKVVRP